MCMSSVEFGLKFDSKEKAYIGRGFKKYTTQDIASNGLKGGQWSEAQGFSKLPVAQANGIDKDSTWSKQKEGINGSGYHAGFHVFLNKEDAENYYQGPGSQVYLVEFKEVLAYGENGTGSGVGKCVIARYMRIVPEPSKPVNKIVKTLKSVKKPAKKPSGPKRDNLGRFC